MRRSSIRRSYPLVLGAALFGCAPAVAPAQQQPAAPAAAPAPRPGPEVGSLAPDFALPAATRYGRLAEPFRLSQFRGQTVVLAFFVQARTRG